MPPPRPDIRPVGTQPPAQTMHLDHMPKARREIIEKILPRPKTPGEAASLPPGTRFITPDGRIKVVPGAAPQVVPVSGQEDAQ
jgi:hypothetical protein